MAHDVFISYSHYDKAVADAVCAYFEQNGLRCWYAPRDIAPGEDWANSIIRAIESSKVMALIFTKDSNLSKQVLREVSNAYRAGVTVIPFRLADIEPVAGMMYYLSTVHWLDAMNDELDEAVKNLYVLSRSIVDKMNEFPDAPKPISPPADGDAQPNVAAADKDKKKKKLTAIISAAAAVAVIGIAAGIIIAVNSTKPSADDNKTSSDSGRTADVIQYDDPDSQEETKVYNIGATIVTASAGADAGVDEDCSFCEGNTQANLQQGGYIATDGEWYYYRSNDGGKMYKMTLGGKKKTQITDEKSDNICVVGDYIYYMGESGFNRIKKDGSDKKLLISLYPYSSFDGQRNKDEVLIYNGRIYYFNFYNVYSYAMDGSDEKSYEKVIDMISDVAFDGKYVYYVEESSRNLYRVDLDTSASECIFDDKVGDLTITGSRLYFFDYDSFGFYSYDLTTGGRTKIYDHQLVHPNVSGDFAFGNSVYANAEGYTNALIRLKLENGTFTKLSTFTDCDRINVCGDKVVFDSGGVLYIVGTDGSDLQTL